MIAPTLAAALAGSCADGPPPGPGETIWTVQPGADGSERGLEIDASGDDVVVGGYRADADDPDATHGWLAAFDDGGHTRWEVEYADVGDRQLVSGVAVDGTGRIAVTGTVRRSEDDWDIWVALYEPDGRPLASWTGACAAGREDQGVGVAVDPGRDEFVAVGYMMNDDSTTDAWMQRFDRDGTALWERTYDGPASLVDVATEVAFDAAGDRFVVVGYDSSRVEDTDLWAEALDEDGQPQWTFRHDEAAGNDRAQSAAGAPGGGIYLVGSAVVVGRTVDAWVGHVTADGTLGWRELFDGPASLGDGANDVAVDPDGNVVVGGYQFSDAGKWDAWVVELGPDHTPRWLHVHAAEAGGDDVIAGVAVDPAGDVLVVGSVSTGEQTRSIWLRKLAG